MNQSHRRYRCCPCTWTATPSCTERVKNSERESCSVSRSADCSRLQCDFDQQSHLLILGDNECGKTATLRTLCREIVRTNTATRSPTADRRLSALPAGCRRVGTPWRLCHFVGRAVGALLPGFLDLLQAADAPVRTRARHSCGPGLGGPDRISMSWSTIMTWSPPRRKIR